MAIRKLWEPFGIRYLRSQVKDSLQYHGEEAVLLQLYHAKDDGKIPSLSPAERHHLLVP